MTEQEKAVIIKDLEWAINEPDVFDALYVDDLDGVIDTMRGALDLIKAQEPRVMTATDFENNPNVDELGHLSGWLETRPGVGEEFEREGWVTVNKRFMENDKYRVWTGRPSEDQKRAVSWE